MTSLAFKFEEITAGAEASSTSRRHCVGHRATKALPVSAKERDSREAHAVDTRREPGCIDIARSSRLQFRDRDQNHESTSSTLGVGGDRPA